MNVNIIVAYCKNGGIGIDNKLPWHFKEDLKYFSKITKGLGNNAIIMGRKTYESIGKELPNRLNIILSRNITYNNIKTCNTIESAIEFCKIKSIDNIFIIGGSQVYEEVLNKKLVHNIFITEIDKEYECDVFFPILDNNFKCTDLKKSDTNELLTYKKFELIN